MDRLFKFLETENIKTSLLNCMQSLMLKRYQRKLNDNPEETQSNLPADTRKSISDCHSKCALISPDRQFDHSIRDPNPG